MSESPERRPRTWVPLAAAAGVGAVVVMGAVAAFALGGGPDESEAAVIAVCESEYAAQGGPAVVAGGVYDPSEWRGYYEVAEAEGEVPVPLGELPDEVADEWESRAAAFRDTGVGEWVIVWVLDDESHAQCAVPVNGSEVDADLAVIGPLAVESPEVPQ